MANNAFSQSQSDKKNKTKENQQLSSENQSKRNRRRQVNTLTCPDYWLLSSRALKKNNIDAISATVKPDGKIEVRQRRANDKLKYFVIDKNSTVRALPIDWSNLRGDMRKRLPGNECLMGKAVLAYIEALKSGKFERVTWRNVNQHGLLAKLKGYYLIDAYGIDQVVNESGPMQPYELKRVYGSTTIFAVNDKTRTASWNNVEQKLGIQGTLKNSKTDDVFVDLYAPVKYLRFKLVESSANQFNEKVWLATIKPGNKICLQWRGDHRNKRCKKHSLANQKKTYYLTDSLPVAKKLLHSISPNIKTVEKKNSKSCPQGAFCNFSGGEYLNAISGNDFQKFRLLDREYLKPLLDKKNEYTKAKDVKILFDLIGFNNDAEFSLLDFFTERYLSHYKNHPEKCLRKNATTLKFSKEVPGTVYVNGYGTETHRSSGYTLTGSYTINSEFVNVCKRICGVDGLGTLLVGGVDAAYNKSRITQVMHGLKQLQDLDCDSSEVKKFEQSLIKFHQLQNKGLYFQRNSD